MKTKHSSSPNHFIDTNVLLQHANRDSGEFEADIAKVLSDAVGISPTRTLWVSSILFAELRPSYFVPGRFSTVEELSRYIRSIATVVTPDYNVMRQAARLRDISWCRPIKLRGKDEKPRRLTLGDAIHVASALWVKESSKVDDLEFLTFDNKAGTSIETDAGTKSLPLLSLEDYTDGLGSDPDAMALVRLHRCKPLLGQAPLNLVAE